MAVRKPLVMIGGVVRGLPDGDSLSSSSDWTAEVVTQAEAEAGTATTARKWTAQRVRQAIAGWWSGIGTAFGKSLLSATDAAAGRTALGLSNVNNTADADKPISTAAANALDTKFDKAGGLISGVFGYGPGAGGTVVQPTSKTTTVTLNKPCGRITMFNDPVNFPSQSAIAAGGTVNFLLKNTLIGASDLIFVVVKSGVVAAIYQAWCSGIIDGLCEISVRNNSGSSASNAVELHFAIIKGALS